MGTGMIALATARFLKTAKDIDSPALRPGTGSRLDTILAALLVLLGISFLFYLSQAFFAKL